MLTSFAALQSSSPLRRPCWLSSRAGWLSSRKGLFYLLCRAGYFFSFAPHAVFFSNSWLFSLFSSPSTSWLSSPFSPGFYSLLLYSPFSLCWTGRAGSSRAGTGSTKPSRAGRFSLLGLSPQGSLLSSPFSRGLALALLCAGSCFALCWLPLRATFSRGLAFFPQGSTLPQPSRAGTGYSSTLPSRLGWLSSQFSPAGLAFFPQGSTFPSRAGWLSSRKGLLFLPARALFTLLRG